MSENEIAKTEKRGGRRLIRALRNFGLSERGSVLVEFSLAIVPFAVVLFAIFEVALVFWGTYELENATEDAARMIRTGQVYAGNIDEAGFKAQICARVSVLVNCAAKLRVDVRNADSFAQLTPPSAIDDAGTLAGNFAYAPGGPKRAVLVTAFYEWPLLNIVSGMSLANLASGNRLLRASAAFRNEPFPE